MPRLVVGLGNPGPKYAATRHNVGFRVADELAALLGVTEDSLRHEAVLAEAQATLPDGGEATAVLCKPMTYMNDSGRAVAAVMREYGIMAEAVLVVVDDVALPLGVLRMRARGSDGGHNGLASIEAELGTDQYPRLRVGVGGEEAVSPDGLIEFVLGEFGPEEEEQLEAVVAHGAQAALDWIRYGLVYCQSRYNGSVPDARGQEREEKH